MMQLLQSDWQRIWKRKKTFVSLLIFVAIVLLDCLFLGVQSFGAFDNVSSVPLTAQNFSLFLLKEVSFFLVLIIGPILMIDSFNGEYHGGQLRLVLIRPISILRLFAAKWINLAVILLLFVAVTFVIGEGAGHLLKPNVDSVVYLNPARAYGPAKRIPVQSGILRVVHADFARAVKRDRGPVHLASKPDHLLSRLDRGGSGRPVCFGCAPIFADGDEHRFSMDG